MTYAGATGYIASGSPGEAMKQTLAWSCTVGQVATSMYDGYQDGGGWTEPWWARGRDWPSDG